MITTTVSDAPSLAVAVLNPAVKWQQQWRSGQEILKSDAVWFAGHSVKPGSTPVFGTELLMEDGGTSLQSGH